MYMGRLENLPLFFTPFKSIPNHFGMNHAILVTQSFHLDRATNIGNQPIDQLTNTWARKNCWDKRSS